MSHEGYHEPADLLPEPTKDLHRALLSLMEELEAIDWYQQRADVSSDAGLKAVMLHNRNEEVEHAMMTLEWIRRRDPKFDETARTYLFKSAPITELEGIAKAAAAGGGEPSGEGAGTLPGSPNTVDASLGIGSLRGK